MKLDPVDHDQKKPWFYLLSDTQCFSTRPLQSRLIYIKRAIFIYFIGAILDKVDDIVITDFVYEFSIVTHFANECQRKELMDHQ